LDISSSIPEFDISTQHTADDESATLTNSLKIYDGDEWSLDYLS
jgi:hypothetical protein